MNALKVILENIVYDRIIPLETLPPRLVGPLFEHQEYTRNHWWDFTDGQKVSFLKELGRYSPVYENRFIEAFNFLNTVPEPPEGYRPLGSGEKAQVSVWSQNWESTPLKEQLKFINALHSISGPDHELPDFLDRAVPNLQWRNGEASLGHPSDGQGVEHGPHGPIQAVQHVEPHLHEAHLG